MQVEEHVTEADVTVVLRVVLGERILTLFSDIQLLYVAGIAACAVAMAAMMG